MSRASLLPVFFSAAEPHVRAEDNFVELTRRARRTDRGTGRPERAVRRSRLPRLPGLSRWIEAIALALANSPAIKAVRTQIQQNQAQETTANLRPNPGTVWRFAIHPCFQPQPVP